MSNIIIMIVQAFNFRNSVNGKQIQQMDYISVPDMWYDSCCVPDYITVSLLNYFIFRKFNYKHEIYGR